MALVGVELETLISEQDALTTRPPSRALHSTLSRSRVELARYKSAAFVGQCEDYVYRYYEIVRRQTSAVFQ